MNEWGVPTEKKSLAHPFLVFTQNVKRRENYDHNESGNFMVFSEKQTVICFDLNEEVFEKENYGKIRRS